MFVVGSQTSGRVKRVFIGMRVVRGPDWLESCTDDSGVTTTGGGAKSVNPGPGVVTVSLIALLLVRLPVRLF